MSLFNKLFGEKPPRKDPKASANDIPKIISQLQAAAMDGSFAVIMFVPANSTDDEPVNLQYSIDDGVVGMDWVLAGPRNIADKAKVMELATKLGYRLEECCLAERYLRMTGNGISELGSRIIQDLYKIDADKKLDLVVEGFEWPA